MRRLIWASRLAISDHSFTSNLASWTIFGAWTASAWNARVVLTPIPNLTVWADARRANELDQSRSLINMRKLYFFWYVQCINYQWTRVSRLIWTRWLTSSCSSLTLNLTPWATLGVRAFTRRNACVVVRPISHFAFWTETSRCPNLNNS